jgi:hypothetical protein
MNGPQKQAEQKESGTEYYVDSHLSETLEKTNLTYSGKKLFNDVLEPGVGSMDRG